MQIAGGKFCRTCSLSCVPAPSIFARLSWPSFGRDNNLASISSSQPAKAELPGVENLLLVRRHGLPEFHETLDHDLELEALVTDVTAE